MYINLFIVEFSGTCIKNLLKKLAISIASVIRTVSEFILVTESYTMIPRLMSDPANKFFG